MDTGNLQDGSFLEEVRVRGGNDKCKGAFREIYENDRQKAADLINDEKITFPCLFVLTPQIYSYGLDAALSSRNLIVTGIIRQIIAGEIADGHADHFSDESGAVHSALKWILQTGSGEYGLEDGYKRVLDITASVLINTYKDKSILPIIDSVIFKRREKGQNFHDLIWAFFRLRDPGALKLMAAHILSDDRDEAEFASEVLNIEACIGTDGNDAQKRYESYLNWLEENDSSLRFTGESFQMTGRPVIYRLEE